MTFQQCQSSNASPATLTLSVLCAPSRAGGAGRGRAGDTCVKYSCLACQTGEFRDRPITNSSERNLFDKKIHFKFIDILMSSFKM